MSSFPLDFGARARREQIARDLRRTASDAVDSIGLGCAAAACGCEPSDLREALDGKRGRRLPLEWVIAVADVAGGSYRAAVFAALLEPFGFEPRPAKPMSDAEYVRHLEEVVREQLGVAGVEAVNRARKEARRG